MQFYIFLGKCSKWGPANVSYGQWSFLSSMIFMLTGGWFIQFILPFHLSICLFGWSWDHNRKLHQHDRWVKCFYCSGDLAWTAFGFDLSPTWVAPTSRWGRPVAWLLLAASVQNKSLKTRVDYHSYFSYHFHPKLVVPQIALAIGILTSSWGVRVRRIVWIRCGGSVTQGVVGGVVWCV